ncbi:MAG: hypothetical protein MJA29_07720 [Candidatus Omnitrophica bacterium]|nr:hypothetical protein [Candidatus Omnitrophota bacterium]
MDIFADEAEDGMIDFYFGKSLDNVILILIMPNFSGNIILISSNLSS